MGPAGPGTGVLDALIALVLLEAAALLWWHWRTGGGLPPRRLLPTLAAGLGLLLAWRAHAAGAPLLLQAGALALAGLAHLADLAGRWRRRAGQATGQVAG